MKLRAITCTCLLVVGGVIMAAGSQPVEQLLKNRDFEEGKLTGWETFSPGWRLSEDDDAHTGKYGLVCDIMTDDKDSFHGVSQKVPVTAGKGYDAAVWIRTVNIEQTRAYLEVQFLDAEGRKLTQFQSAHVTDSQPFKETKLINLKAPEKATHANVRGIVWVKQAPTKDEDFVVFDDFSFTLAK